MNTTSLRRLYLLDDIKTHRQTETICKGHLSRRNGRRRERRGAAPEVNDTGGVEKSSRDTDATMDRKQTAQFQSSWFSSSIRQRQLHDIRRSSKISISISASRKKEKNADRLHRQRKKEAVLISASLASSSSSSLCPHSCVFRSKSGRLGRVM